MHAQKFLSLISVLCLLVAACDDAASSPPSDEPPTIDSAGVSPSTEGLVIFDLTRPVTEVFGVAEVTDIDEEETLYSRVIIDLEDAVIILEDATLPTGARQVNFELNPCQDPLVSLELRDRLNAPGDDPLVYRFYIAVSDRPFAQQGDDNATAEALLKTAEEPDREVAVVSWMLQFSVDVGEGVCGR